MRFIGLFFLVVSAFFLFSFIFLPDSFASDGCDEWVGKIVSVQGSVQARGKDATQWTPVQFNDIFCPGDMLRVQEHSRAAIYLINNTLIRIDQNTTIKFTEVKKKEVSWLEFLSGAVHFISRIPRTLKVNTPFVDGTVEGTEFFVRVAEDHAVFTVFEGTVLASNQTGSLSLGSGQSALARKGEAPIPHVVVRPRDSVQWALYYPPVISYQSGDLPAIRESLQKYWRGDIKGALSGIKDVLEETGDARLFNYRAGLLLSVGRVDEAYNDINRALILHPGNSDSTALQSIIAVVNNNKDEALNIAQKAAEKDPDSATAKIALSYAQQASFDLDGALASVEEAVKISPENGLAWARLSELQLSFGNLDKALESANKAVELNPDLARTQTVLGYAFLTQVKTDDAKEAFDRAIVLDQADPLPRLGLGLAMIRKGKLAEGREEIEIATSLDPNNSLMRSYAGKAYYEEKRDKLAKSQYDIAKELDPLDPTPYFYDAIRKQTINRPVEALHDLQKSVELNDNRAIYRSKELLDDDLAARSASLARIYNDLGFEQLALVEGWNSVNTDPGNYSAHRFLADSYSALPRHEIARVSELLQSQLLQPLNVTPVQPRLAETGLFLLDGAGPGALSFNEFNPLFNRNKISLQLSSVVGENSTFGDEVVLSGILNNFSFSLGQFHYETDGFRKNNDQTQDIYNVFVQMNPSHKTSFLAEFRYKDGEEGDLPLRFDNNGQENFSPNRRKEIESKSFRMGFRHSLSERSDIIAHWTLVEFEESAHDATTSSTADIAFKDEGYMAEAQYLFRSDLFHLTGGIGHFSADRTRSILVSLIVPPIPLVNSFAEPDISHTNLYVYADIHFPENFVFTFGGSADFFDGDLVDEDQFNPKFGLTWTPFSGTTLRVAGFRTLKRTLASDQTIEPTQVAGFNQFFDDDNGTDAWRYGIAVDQKISESVYGGFEYTQREQERPFLVAAPDGDRIGEADWDEKIARAYLYWTPKPWLALSAEYLFEQFERDPDETGEEQILDVDTHRVPLEVRIFCPSGLNARLGTTYVHQDGEFGSPGDFYHGDDQFWVVDTSIGYRLPKRYGTVTIGVKNLFDEEFQFQDTDLTNQSIYPERLIFGKLTVAF